jgi:hypothetical protein
MADAYMSSLVLCISVKHKARSKPCRHRVHIALLARQHPRQCCSPLFAGACTAATANQSETPLKFSASLPTGWHVAVLHGRQQDAYIYPNDLQYQTPAAFLPTASRMVRNHHSQMQYEFMIALLHQCRTSSSHFYRFFYSSSSTRRTTRTGRMHSTWEASNRPPCHTNTVCTWAQDERPADLHMAHQHCGISLWYFVTV